MNSKDIQSVIALMERHGVATFDYEHGTTQLHLTVGADAHDAAPASPDPAAMADPETIRSPGVGIVLYAHPANAGPVPALHLADVGVVYVAGQERDGVGSLAPLAVRDLGGHLRDGVERLLERLRAVDTTTSP